jgi:pimeloyl-ACP methyl ester carboxylesterase
LSPNKINGQSLPTHSFEEHWITLDGARMRYLRSGIGPPLLLVHGLLGYSFSWRFAIPVLSQQATVYAVDMLGVGFSDRPSGLDCCLRASAERLLRFLDSAAIVSCDWLGTSHGGAVAMMAAALAPERIRRLILVAPVNPWSSHGRFLAQALSSPVISAMLLQTAPFLQVTHSVLLRRLYGDTSRIRPGTLAGYSAPFEKPGALNHALGILRSWNHDLADLETMLPHIAHIPALLVWGARDAAVDPASAARLSQVFDHCRTVMLDGVGHLPYEEVPEEFNRIVGKFLERTSVAQSKVSSED